MLKKLNLMKEKSQNNFAFGKKLEEKKKKNRKKERKKERMKTKQVQCHKTGNEIRKKSQ